MPKLLHHVCIS